MLILLDLYNAALDKKLEWYQAAKQNILINVLEVVSQKTNLEYAIYPWAMSALFFILLILSLGIIANGWRMSAKIEAKYGKTTIAEAILFLLFLTSFSIFTLTIAIYFGFIFNSITALMGLVFYGAIIATVILFIVVGYLECRPTSPK